MDARREAAALIRENLKATGLEKAGRVVQGDAISFLSGCRERFGVIFLDPVSYTHLDVYKRQLRGSPGFSGVKPVSASLQRADMGGSLSTRELLDIASVRRCARGARDYGDSEEKTVISHPVSYTHLV